MNFGKRVSLFLLPSIVQGVVAFGMVPVATYVLGPEDFGVFALVSTMTALPSAIASLGSGYLLAAHYPAAGVSERRSMISTILLAGLLVLLAFTTVALTLWPWLTQNWKAMAIVPTMGIILSCLAMLLAYPWSIAIDTITLDAKARLYAMVGIGQSVLSALTIIVGLYLLQWGVLSLFAGAVAGASLQFVGAVLALRLYLSFRVDVQWVRQIMRVGMPATTANLIENLQGFFERYLLTAYSGFAQLGLYYHSQQYRNVVSAPVKAIARSVWPITLVESKERHTEFLNTKRAWNVTYVGITVVGVLFATLGKPLIAWWTHDKFSEAYWMAAAWMVFILIQNSGKAQTGILYANDEAPYYMKSYVMSSIAAIIMLFLLVALIGTVGVILAVIAQQVLFRILLQLRARKYAQASFQDHWVVTGSGVILLALSLSTVLGLETIGRGITFLVICMVIGVMARRILVGVVSKSMNWLSAPSDAADRKDLKISL